MTTLLVHQASWETLRKCTHQLLESDRDSYDSKAVLDFLAALVKVPKLWQGRDKHVPKHYEPENLLHLNRPQVFFFASVEVFIRICTYFSIAFAACRVHHGRIHTALSKGQNKSPTNAR